MNADEQLAAQVKLNEDAIATGDLTDNQDLSFSAGVISLTGDPTSTNIDLSAYDANGSDDMLINTYDTDDNDIVDNAEQVNGLTVETSVPANATIAVNGDFGSSNLSTTGTLGAGATTVSSLTVTDLAGSESATYNDDDGAPGKALTINASGVFSTSDKRLKTNIALLQGTLAKLDSLGGYNYHYKSDAEKKKQIGVIAQELEQVYPELVTKDERGYRMVNYQGLIPVLLEAIKEQQALIQNLDRKITDQEKKLADLENDNNKMKGDVELIKKMLLGSPAAQSEEK